MNIKKIGHCCLVITIDDMVILTDPGSFSTGQDQVKNINIILITHEHADHLHIDSLVEVMKNNPEAKVITNSAVGAILDQKNITHTILEGKGTTYIKDVLIEAFDSKHEEIFEEIGIVQNTGYFINNTLFYPGDSFCNPEKPVDVLALPVAGPWCKISDAIRYALTVRPKKAFPVHDGMIIPDRIGAFHKLPETVLAKNGIEFVVLGGGESKEF